jgi:hypothetical protein
MTDDMNDGTDTMWAQYAAALLHEAVGDDFDAATQAFSIGSILLFVDVAAADPAVANYAVFRLGNNIPPWSGSYIAASTLFTSYWSFLAYIDLAELAPTPVANGMATAEAAVRQQLARVIQDVQNRHAAWMDPTRRDPQSISAQLQDLRDLGSKITGLRKAAASRACHHPANGGADAIDAVIDGLSRCLTAASPVEPSLHASGPRRIVSAMAGERRARHHRQDDRRQGGRRRRGSGATKAGGAQATFGAVRQPVVAISRRRIELGLRNGGGIRRVRSAVDRTR